MWYKILVNVPNSGSIREISISQEQLDGIKPALENKRIIKIGDGYLNTAYIIEIVADVEANRIEGDKVVGIEEQSGITQVEKRKEGMNNLRDILKNKRIIK